MALGASVFSAIESPIEQQEIKDLIDRKKAFIKGHACVDGKNKLLLVEKLFSYIIMMNRVEILMIHFFIFCQLLPWMI